MSKEKSRSKEIIADEIVVGPPKLTRFERARIIGARGLQISLGAPILIRIKKEMNDPIIIAEEELERDVLPLTVARRLPDTTYQNIPLSWLLKGKK
ncbi:MAG: DNA-directed RNA polymerase subunit K [Asgard group archaeon]|nr:DNA-directed RNA polymerase subunit K [Asgard group archaeon]